MVMPWTRQSRLGVSHVTDHQMNTTRPVVVVSVIQELILRSGLTNALRGRNDKGLKPILAFLTKYISNPRFSSLLIDVTHALLGALRDFHLTHG